MFTTIAKEEKLFNKVKGVSIPNEETLVIDRLETELFYLEQEKEVLTERIMVADATINVLNGMVRKAHVDRIKTRVFSCAIIILNCMVTASMVYWTSNGG